MLLHTTFDIFQNFLGGRQTASKDENAGAATTDPWSELMLFFTRVRCAVLTCALWTRELYGRASVICATNYNFALTSVTDRVSSVFL